MRGMEPYTHTAATVDDAPAHLTLRVSQGDDLFERFTFCSVHRDEFRHAYQRVPIDISATVFGAVVFNRDDMPVAMFELTDDPDRSDTIEARLPASETSKLKAGTYTWWLRGGDTNAKRQRTYLQGQLEIMPRVQ